MLTHLKIAFDFKTKGSLRGVRVRVTTTGYDPKTLLAVRGSPVSDFVNSPIIGCTEKQKRENGGRGDFLAQRTDCTGLLVEIWRIKKAARGNLKVKKGCPWNF